MVALSSDSKSKTRYHLAYNGATPAGDRASLERAMNEVLDSWTVTKIEGLLTRCDNAELLTVANPVIEKTRTEYTGDVVRTQKGYENDDYSLRLRKYLQETNNLARSLGVRNYRDPSQAANGYYLNGGIYIKSVSGPEGDKGDKGTSWITISGTPTAANPSTAVLLDYCVDNVTGQYYQKTALVDPAWTLLGDIIIPGPPGADGAPGPTGATGSVSAASAIELVEQVSDPAAIAAKTLIYAKTDHKVYKRISDGTISEVGAGAGGGGGLTALTANKNLYVRTDGNDSNLGDVNSSGGAFLTPQKAVDTMIAFFGAGFDGTIFIAVGTYTIPIILKNFVGFNQITIEGVSGTILSVTSNNGITVDAIYSKWILKDFKIQTTTLGFGIQLKNKSLIYINNLDFGDLATGYTHIVANNNSTINVLGNYRISGSGGARHISLYEVSNLLCEGRIVTITNTPIFDAYVLIDRNSFGNLAGCTFTGSATGPRYFVSPGSQLYVSGASGSLPGNSGGTGGGYVT